MTANNNEKGDGSFDFLDNWMVCVTCRNRTCETEHRNSTRNCL